MYLYFDVNGNLREIIYNPVREGSYGVDKIFIYVEPQSNPIPEDGEFKLPSSFNSAKISFKALNTNQSLNGNDGTPLSMTKLSGDDSIQIPYDSKRDLKWFKYGYKYEVWSVTLPTEATAESGTVVATTYLYSDSVQLALNTFTFNVEESVGIVLGSTMSESQYSYLYNKIQNIRVDALSEVPFYQMTVTVVLDALTNINGRELTAYESNLETFGTAPNTYKGYKITYNDEILTETQAMNFMEFMTGSKFLPVYDYEKPKNSLFLLPNGAILKPQYDSTNGLVLYVIGDENGFLATKSAIENGTIVAKKAEQTGFTLNDFVQLDLSESNTLETGFYYVYYPAGAGVVVNFGMIYTGREEYPAYTSGMLTYAKYGDDEYCLQIDGMNSGRINVYKNGDVEPYGILLVKRVK